MQGEVGNSQHRRENHVRVETKIVGGEVGRVGVGHAKAFIFPQGINGPFLLAIKGSQYHRHKKESIHGGECVSGGANRFQSGGVAVDIIDCLGASWGTSTMVDADTEKAGDCVERLSFLAKQR